MKVSIVLPSFNQGPFIGRTLDTVFSQDYDNLEVIVVDGASTDNTVEVLQQYQAKHPNLRWLSEPDKGPADAVNKGLAMATGEVCGIQSTDDLYLPGAVSTVAEAFERHADAQMVYGNVNVINGNDEFVSETIVPEFSWESWFGITLCVPQSSIFFKTDLARRLGGWRGQYFGCDLDLWLRMLFQTTPVHVNRTLSSWRVYEEQRTTPQHYAKILDGFRRMIDDSEEIAAAPFKIRRLARAARHLAAVHFGPAEDMWTRRWHALCALFWHPSYPRYAYGPLVRSMLPGYGRLRRLKKRLTQS
jgi:glycosyltransferase involved in cell wall biosynthesis